MRNDRTLNRSETLKIDLIGDKSSLYRKTTKCSDPTCGGRNSMLDWIFYSDNLTDLPESSHIWFQVQFLLIFVQLCFHFREWRVLTNQKQCRGFLVCSWFIKTNLQLKISLLVVRTLFLVESCAAIWIHFVFYLVFVLT